MWSFFQMPFNKSDSKLFNQVTGNDCFWVHEGPVICSLSELAQALGEMNQEQYQHHVSHEKNDFANWVEDIFEDQKLARQLRRAPNQRECQKVIMRRLKMNKV